MPRRIGKYEVFLEIGSGGMARVYLAGLRGGAAGAELVVVKVLRREVLEDEHVVALFLDEARIATRLRHPNVILTREVVAQPPDYLLAMEFQDGQSLLQVLRRLGRNALSLDEHIWILTQVLAGLAHAHALTDGAGRPLAIVHRDVSPSNVLVCYSGEIKLLDFGIAKATGALARTQDGVVKGKVGYAAPEQCLGKPADPRSDIYAVGVMLWEAIAGRRRASGETWHSVLQARIDNAEPRLEEVCPDAPEALSVIAQRALAHEPEMRYATAREFQKDLEAYLAARKATVTPARIAAVVGPHFVRDREEQQRAIDAYLGGQQSHVSGRRRIPLPGPVLPLPAEPHEDEDTSRIPVDDLLLMKSRTGSVAPPAGASVPPIPAIPPAASNPPPIPKRGTPPHPSRAGAASSAPSSAPLPGVPPSPQGSSAAPGVPVSSGASTAPSVPSPPRASVAPSVDAADVIGEPAPERGRGPRVVAIAAIAIGLVAGAVWALRPRLRVEVVPAAAPPPARLQAQAAAPPAPSPQVLPTVNQVRVRIAVTPADAELRLDGLLLKGNPFTSVFPKSDEIHELSATADGFREEKQAVQFIQDVDLQISLRRGRGAPRVVALRPIAPAAAVPARPTAEARPATPAVEPGMDLKSKADTRGKRTIDEKDPYSQ